MAHFRYNLHRLKTHSHPETFSSLLDAVVFGPAEVEVVDVEEVLGVKKEEYLRSKFRRNETPATPQTQARSNVKAVQPAPPPPVIVEPPPAPPPPPPPPPQQQQQQQPANYQYLQQQQQRQGRLVYAPRDEGRGQRQGQQRRVIKRYEGAVAARERPTRVFSK